MKRININNISIKNKLIAIQLFTVFIVLSLYSVFHFFSDMNEYRDTVSRKLATMAGIIGYNCKSPLNFLDNKAAEEILLSLEAEENVVNACIYDAEGNMFGKYAKAGHSDYTFPEIEGESQEFKAGYFFLSKPIVQDNETIGMVALRFDMSRYHTVLTKNVFVAFLVLTGGMLLAFFLSVFTQKSISNPIFQLVETLKKVGETGDYSIRSETSWSDEIGLLHAGFNEMVSRIQSRQIERDRTAEALRQRVREITALNTLGRKVGAGLSVEQVVQSALEGIHDPVQPDFAVVFLKVGDQLVHQGSEPVDLLHHEKIPRHPVGQCLCGMAAGEAAPVYSVNIQSDIRCTWGECDKRGLRSFAALPLKGRDEVIGVLGLASHTERDFEKEHTFLETLSNEIAIGMQNALLFEKISQYSAELEERVAERTAELSRANVKLKELDRLKSMFLASMSHELRTPLNSIIGFTGLLLMGMVGDLNPEQKKQLTLVKSSANHLLSLINDILDISKIESGKVNLAVETFHITGLVKDVAETVSPTVEAKGLQLTTDLPKDLEITSDQRRVKQVLMNLVGNAAKFTEKGNINITVKTIPGRQLEVAVSDTGMGVKEEDMVNLFMPFRQIDMSSTKAHEGTGLGLYLCKKLTALLGGDISAASEYGKGSRFSFRLPLNPTTGKES